jgi:hypothetical protein
LLDVVVAVEKVEAAVDAVMVAVGKIPAYATPMAVSKKRKREGEEEEEGTVGLEYGDDTLVV